MKKFALLTSIFILCSSLYAQLNYEKRIEFELRNGYGDEFVYQSKQGSFILESTADEEVNGQTEVKYDLYNSDLILENSVSVMIPDNMRFDAMYSNDQVIYNFYKNKKQEFLITGVDFKTLEISKTSGVIPVGTRIQDMKILGDYAWFYAIIKKQPFIYRIELDGGKATTIPVQAGAYSPKSLMVENYQILEQSSEILVLLRAKVKKGVYETFVMRITPDGSVDKAIKLAGVGDNNISSVSGCRISENSMIFTGTYSKDNLMSEGLFFGEMSDNQVNYIKYYNFLDLKDFLKYLPEKRQAKIEKKKSKKEAQGKEFSIDYYIADHDVIVLDDGFIFLGEAYYPTYRTESYTTYVNGTPTTTYRTVFDGYQYTHAVVARFSKEGDLMWDVCFEMWPGYKPFYVKRFIAISDQSPNSINMVFTIGNKIRSKTVSFDGEELSTVDWDMMKTGNENDEAKMTSSQISYWYGNYFLAYGSQTIKNDEGGNKKKRKVYFVNKIGFPE